ncbi:DUF1674 domain-containing protein [Caulobacter sp. S45]|uniref:DUF1674 domain-containing protein n=1 Tax=Caulobacter sp. S45 TaxID=1641861 RepID=UPI0015764882|nr:DUF1674 domain-containing protein [Caulobacter sp. S45]
MTEPVLLPGSKIDATLGAAPGKPLSDAARRALQEAIERRAAIDAATLAAAEAGEKGGPAGLEPTRYGDWERKGMAIDFS